MTDRKSNLTTPFRRFAFRVSRFVFRVGTPLGQPESRNSKFETVTGAWAILPAVLLAMHLFSTASVSAQVVTGRPGVADMKAVVSMRGIAYLEKTLNRTNRQPKAVHSPLPVTSAETQHVAGASSGGGGGGFTAASAPGEPLFAPAAVPPPGVSPPVATSFQAILDNNTVIPPDTHGAVGPNHVMTVLNSEVRIQDRVGNIISTVSIDGFWRAVGNPVAFDPKLLYDPYNNRWMFTACANPIGEQSSILMGVTQTSDPTGNWNLYRVDADPANIDWADYPSLGFNKDWIVVSINMFPIGFGGFFTQIYSGENIYVFNKTNLYANGAGKFTLLKDTSLKGFTLVPSITYDNTLSTMYLVQVDNLLPALGNFIQGVDRLQISTITGPVGAEVLDLSSAFTPATNAWQSSDLFFSFGGSGLQKDLPFFFGVDLGDSRMQNVVYRNGSLWCTHAFYMPLEFPAFTPFHSGVQWWQITPNGQVQQFGRIEDPLGQTSYAYPSIAVNRCNDVLIGYSSFNTNQYPSANYSFRYSTDAPSALRSPALLKAGEAPYFKTFGGFANRWGDYSSTVVDPVNDVDMWTIQEYSAASFFPTNIVITNFFNFGLWATWWGRIDVIGGNTNQILFSSGNYTVSETASKVVLTVLNPGGLASTVDYATADGTAIAGQDYLETHGSLSFAAAQLSQTIEVPILDNTEIHSNKTFTVSLSSPGGGPVLGCLDTTVVTIEDDESLSQPNEAGEFVFSTFLNFGIPYLATENESGPSPFCGFFTQSIIQPDRSAPGVIVTVVRTNGSTGKVLVDFSTPPGGSAVPGVDYYPTNGTLVFDDFQNSATFLVRTRNDAFVFLGAIPIVDWVRVALSNPRPAPEEEAARPGVIRPKLGNGSESGIIIYNINGGILDDPLDPTSGLDWWNIERHNYRADEYSTYGTNGGTRTINFDVTLFPNGGPGNVTVQVSSLGGGYTYFVDPFSFSFRSPDSSFKVVHNAGSERAEAFENQAAIAAGTQQPFTRSQVWPNSIYLDPSQSTITNSSDYGPFQISVGFGGGQCRRSISVVITNDNTVEFNEDFVVALVGGNPNLFGPNLAATITILQDDPPAGAVDREWNPDNASPTFRSTPGANYMVSAVAVQPDGKTVFGGDFDRVNSEVRNHVARMNVDGSLDTSFQPGGGASGFVSSVIAYPSNSLFAGRILIAGGFESYNSQDTFGIARLLGNGSLDLAFANAVGTGANGPIRAMVLQADGRIVIAGDFTIFDGVDRLGFARLNFDGSLDPSFNVVGGTDGITWSLAAQPDGAGGEKILVAGDYDNISDEFRGGIARLNTDGSVDTSFDPGAGADGAIYALTVQTNGQVLIAGDFTSINAITRARVARLEVNGVLDINFDPGAGPDNAVFALTLQPDGKAVIGGMFTSYNSTRRVGLARLLLDGSLDTSFMDTAYNQFAGIINDFSFESANFINSIALQPDGNMIIGGAFTKVGGNPSASAPLRNNYTVFTRADKRTRYNIARIVGGVTPGPGNASFSSEDYFTDEQSGTAYLEVVRTDGRLGTLTASSFPSNRLASAGLDYSSNVVQMVWPEAFYMTNFLSDFPTNFGPASIGFISPLYVPVPLLDDLLQEGDELVDMRFFRPTASVTLGGELIPLGGALGRASSTLTIADNDAPRGVIAFKSAQYFTNEFNGFARITVIRTNGSNGRVTARWTTTTATTPPAATPGRDYNFATGTVVFNSGDTEETFDVQILNDTDVEFDENVGLVLSNPGQGATLPDGAATTSAMLTIIDTDVLQGRLNFAAITITTNEDAGAVMVGVTRSGGSQSAVSVQYTTLNGTATAPSDYATTSGTLNWDAGDSTTKLITIPLVVDGVVDNPASRFETFSVRLFNSRIGATLNSSIMGNRTNATVVIEDADAYGTLAFSQTFYQTDENAGSANITVVRRNGLAGTVTVDFSVAPGAGTTLADYVPTGGTLTFLAGESSKSFAITILDDSVPDGNKTLVLALANPVNASLGSPSIVTNTIIDDETVNIPAGDFDTTFKTNTQINGPVYSVALQTDGRILVAGEFSEVNNVTRSSVARLDVDGTLDTGLNPGAGPNGAVRSMVLQPDGRILLGGFFSQYNGTNRNGIARINSDGVMDVTFNPGAGANNPVYAIALQADNKILVAGAFSAFGGTNIPGIVRLNTNGTLDHTFATSVGANNTVYALALQPDGKIVIGGEFNAVGGQFHPYLARLNRDGSVDASFNPLLDGAARALLVQPDGRIVAGGSFVTANGVTRSRLARFNPDGTLDTTFLASPLVGSDSVVLALAQQVDGKVIVAGDFRRFNGVTRNRLTRLNTDGTTDPTINFGNGADSFVATIAIQPDRKIVFGGGFTMFDDQPRQRIARIYGGSIAGAGAIEFSKPEFVVQENATNAVVSVRRRLGTTGAAGANYQTLNGTALAGIDYTAVAGTLSFPEGETRSTVTIPIIDNSVPGGDRVFTVELVDGSFTGGAVPGPDPSTRVVIVDDEGMITFRSADYSSGENAIGGFTTIDVDRVGGTNNLATVNFSTANGSATAPADYLSTNGTLVFLPGETLKRFRVPIINDTLIEPSETVFLTLSAPSGSNVLGIATATLLISDNEFGFGQFTFAAPSYVVTESSTNVVLTILRTNGYSGVVSVRYQTADFSALAGLDYVATNNILSFPDGEFIRTIEVPILDDLLVESPEFFSVVLSNPTGGAQLGAIVSAQVRIDDNDISLIEPAGSTLVFESGPVNSAIDPGETVTLALVLRNRGSGNTSNLVATLLPGNGVTAPSGPATYGVLIAGGAAVSRNFTLTASGSNGDRLLATLLLTDGTFTNGFVSFSFTIGGQASRTFVSTNRITINDSTAASPYPATLTVANMGGTITRIAVTLTNFAHKYPSDVDVLLVSPGGQLVTLMSDAGSTASQPNAVTNVTLKFDAFAATAISETGPLTSGTYRPANYAGPFNTSDQFDPPAPQPVIPTDPRPYANTNLLILNGSSPNGIWSLFVMDDELGEIGSINGWSLDIQTSDPVVAPINLALAASGGPNPVLLGATVNSTFTVTNKNNNTATGVVLTDQMPSGMAFLAASASAGTWDRVGGTFRWNIGSMAGRSSATIELVAQPTTIGTLTSTLTVGGHQADLNIADNSATTVTTVVPGAVSLTVIRQGNTVQLSWPANTGMILQSADRVNSPNWTDVGTAPDVLNNQNLISLGVGTANKFFRLRASNP